MANGSAKIRDIGVIRVINRDAAAVLYAVTLSIIFKALSLFMTLVSAENNEIYSNCCLIKASFFIPFARISDKSNFA